MKLNNVIILNRKHMKEFFSFSDFWSQRKEFQDVANNGMFFKHKDNNKNQLKAQVINWINNRSLTAQMKLSQTYITLPSGDISRVYSTECESELSLLKREEAYGVVCLYEMMERQLKQDIYEILACLDYEIFNPISGVILVSNGTIKELDPYVKNDNKAKQELNNVLIVNQSTDRVGGAIIRFNKTEYSIKSGECIRSIFMGNKCIKILPKSCNSMQFVLNNEQYTTGLSINGSIIKTEGDVVAFAMGKRGGYIYATKSKNKKFVASHHNIADEYFYNPMRENENIVYIELSGNETECLLLTNKKNLYLCKADNENEVLFIDENVTMATFNNNKLQIIKD